MEDIKGGVYKISSPVGKIYIGKSIDVARRIRQYERLNCTRQPLLLNSFKKYGYSSHNIEILAKSDCYDELNRLEIMYIKLYKSNVKKYGYEHGLNMTDGGDGTIGYSHTDESKKKMSLLATGREGMNNPMFGKTHSEYTKRLISKKAQGRTVSDEVKKKLKESSKKMWAERYDELYNRIFTTEFREKIKQANLGRVINKEVREKMSKNSAKNKSKLVLDLQTGIYYDSIKDASLTTNYAESTVRCMLNSKSKRRNRTSFVLV